MNAAAFAPKALRRASPKLAVDDAERRREFAEHAWFDKLTMSALILSLSKDAVSAFNVILSSPEHEHP